MSLRIAMTETCNAYAAMPRTLAQLPALADRLDDIRAANVEHHLALIAAAAAAGVKVIGLGELFPAPYFALCEGPFWAGMAEPIPDGPTITALRAAAADHGLVILAPIMELHPSGKRYNTSVFIDADGTALGAYRKLHIPHGANEQGAFIERSFYGHGDEPAPVWAADKNLSSSPWFPVFETRHAKIGTSICYDRHFEGVHRALARNGAQIIFSPAVTFGEQSRRMWPLEFQVDAVRHRVFIAGSNRLGAEPPWNQPYFGDSLVAGPSGILPADRSVEGLVIVDVELESIAAGDGSGWQLVEHARSEIF